MADQDPYAATAVKTPAVSGSGDPYAATAVQPSTATPSFAAAPSAPPEGFWASVLAPLIGTVKGLKSAVYEGPQNPQEAAIVGADEKNPEWASPILGRAVLTAKRILVDPQVEQGKQAISELQQANAETPWYSFQPSPNAVEHRELAGGHALAVAVPFLGPWVASVGQKEGEQIGTGNYRGAAGTALGNALLALAPKGAGKAVDTLHTAPEAIARAITDTGKGPVERLVADIQAANEKIDAVNGDRIEAQRKAQAQADYDHKANLLKLKQNYDQDVRDATENARTGTAQDRAEYQGKLLASKQKYDQNVRDAQQAYETKKAAAIEANAEAQRQYNRKIGETVQKNKALTAAEQAQKDRAARLQVGGSQLIYGLNRLSRALRDRANDMYAAVAKKMAGASLPSDTLADTVRAAQEKWIRGSPEKVKEFNTMLSTGSPGPEIILADQTAQNMGYKNFKSAIANPQMRDTLSRALPPDVWQAAIGQGTKPISWNDLQGFYEETGARIADGPQPGKGDIYQALKQVHDSIGDQMRQLAKTRGADKQFDVARAFYRDYMNTFHEPTGPSGSGSPVAQVLRAKDPAVAAAKFSGPAGDRGIALLRRYSPALADLAQDVQRTAQAKVSATTKSKGTIASIPKPNFKPVPTGPNFPLPPVLEAAPALRASNLPLPPVLPEPETVPVELKPQQTISAPDIEAARAAAHEARTSKVQNRGQWAATWPIFQAMRALWGGHVPSIPTMGLESAGMLATVRATTQLMRYPPLMKFLLQARPEDVALIPPELRGDLPGLVAQAQQRGIRVSPALTAAAAMAGQAANRQANGDASVAPTITPDQAIQAVTGGVQ